MKHGGIEVIYNIVENWSFSKNIYFYSLKIANINFP